MSDIKNRFETSDVKTRKSQNLYKKKVKRPRRYKKKVII